MQSSAKFRKLPVVIEAMSFDGTWASAKEILEWIEAHKSLDHGGPTYWDGSIDDPTPSIYLTTLEGRMRATPGDWIIRGVRGEFYPCKPDIFNATYEPVDAD